MKKLTESQLVQAFKDGMNWLENNQTKDYVYVYPFGFVANKYSWPAPAERLKVDIYGNYNIMTYDRKRSRGHGPYISGWKYSEIELEQINPEQRKHNAL